MDERAQKNPWTITEALTVVAGKLSLSGAPTELVQGSHEDALAVILTYTGVARVGLPGVEPSDRCVLLSVVKLP